MEKNTIIRLIAALCITILVCFGVYTFIYGVWLVNSTKAKYSSYTELSVTPINKEIKSFSGDTRPSQPISHFGLSITVPWADKASIQEKDGIASYKFKGKTLAIVDAPSDTSVANTLDTAKKVFSTSTTESTYSLEKFVLEGTPENLKLLESKKATESNVSRLNLKLIRMDSNAPKIYNFDNGTIKGFQFGDAENGTVFLQIFNKDNKEYDIRIKRNVVTQDDIDFILASVQFN